MVWKISAANSGLNDIPGLCELFYTELTAQSIFLCQSICLLDNDRFGAFKLFMKKLTFTFFNMIIEVCFTLLLIGRCCFYCVILLFFLFSSSVPNMLL
jgi:hypothetical protein